MARTNPVFVIGAVLVVLVLMFVPGLDFLGGFLGGEPGTPGFQAEGFRIVLQDFTSGGFHCVSDVETIEVDWSNDTGVHALNTTGADWDNTVIAFLVLENASLIGEAVEDISLTVSFFSPLEIFVGNFQLNTDGQTFSGTFDRCDPP